MTPQKPRDVRAQPDKWGASGCRVRTEPKPEACWETGSRLGRTVEYGRVLCAQKLWFPCWASDRVEGVCYEDQQGRSGLGGGAGTAVLGQSRKLLPGWLRERGLGATEEVKKGLRGPSVQTAGQRCVPPRGMHWCLTCLHTQCSLPHTRMPHFPSAFSGQGEAIAGTPPPATVRSRFRLMRTLS